ncbi:MAG TPA: 30S ribosomal protein S12 methylthiotransferase RimO [Mycobacteriales bacterium]|nr:30S ribosomal protein S12 methylthiotransferase RimO [Mycobacteriales bacterium]
MSRSVALVTLGCGRNEVDSEELAARLEQGGWQLTEDAESADAVLVNTCGFIEAAKRDSIDTLLDAADSGRHVVAVGCLAERYGDGLARELPEIAVLGFDDYASIAERLDDVVAGRGHISHPPRDRRQLLPISPVERPAAPDVGIPGHAGGPRSVLRRRLSGEPVAPLKLASGCDRRCTFCAIPSFRGAFVSRPPNDIVAEAEWLADRGVSELLLVSENSTSYGKDLGDLQALERLLPRLAAIGGVQRVRVSYLQPAEVRPTLLDAIASTEGVAAYYDISFQHAAEPLLRRMRRFGGTDRFLELIAAIRERTPDAGIRSNFIVGFPGESDADAAELERFLTEARLDAVGIFGYSDEDGTEAASFADKVADDVIAARVARLTALAEELTAQRAEDRIGQPVEVLVEAVEGEVVEGRGEHQAPEVDGSVLVRGAAGRMIGGMVSALVVGSDGVDLLAEPR